MDTNPQKLRAVTFRDAVRLPGTSMTGHYIPAEDYPLTYYPELALIKATLRPGVNPMPHQARTRYYGRENVKDMELLEDPVETAVRDVGGVLAIPEGGVEYNAATGTFERRTGDAAPVPAPTPAETPKAKRGKKARPAVTVAAVDPHAGVITTKPAVYEAAAPMREAMRRVTSGGGDE